MHVSGLYGSPFSNLEDYEVADLKEQVDIGRYFRKFVLTTIKVNNRA
jgi:hypothetical protein